MLAKGALTQSERKGYFINNVVATDFAITTWHGGTGQSKLMHNGYDDHARMFEEVRTAMNTIGFARPEQMEIVQAVCSLLHLSNLTLPGALLAVRYHAHSDEDTSNEKDDRQVHH